jgi:hypothetical protein
MNEVAAEQDARWFVISFHRKRLLTVMVHFPRWFIRKSIYLRKPAIIVNDRLHGERSGKRFGTKFVSVATVAETKPKRKRSSRKNEANQALTDNVFLSVFCTFDIKFCGLR